MSAPRAATAFCAAVRETIARRGMDEFPPGPILAAVSGGADSLALMYALHRLNYAVEVAHFDHRARAGSRADAEFVRAQAGKLGLPFHLGTPAPGDERRRGESPEESMRRARLAYLERVAGTVGATRIATGHTLDDQAETVLLRLIAGAGRRGLGGIPPVRPPYVRPLIDRKRSETEAFCAALRIQPRRDPSNEDRAFARNAVRSDLLPAIARSYNARIAETLAREADVLRDEDEVLDALAAEALVPDAAGGALRMSVDALVALHPAMQRRVIRRAAALDAAQTERVRRLASDGVSGDELFLAQGLNARLEYGFLVLGPAPSSPVRPETVPLHVPGTTDLPGWTARIRATIAPRPSSFPDGVWACALDVGAADDGLVVRRPKPADRFRPFGARGSKKLSDLFTDAKVPRPERLTTPVVAAPGSIVWVVGHRIDERAKVRPAAKRALVLEWEHL